MGDRFEMIYSQNKGLGTDSIQIWVDRATGVQYLFRRDGYGGGICPLLGPDGQPYILDS